MQRFKRIILIVLLALFALAAVVLLAVNLYVQSQGIQTRIEQELSQRLRTPLHIRRISVTPWGGLNLSGLTIPPMFNRQPNNFLEAKTFRFRIALLSLFSQRLVIKQILIVDPHVIWPQNSDGKWSLPGSTASTAQSSAVESHDAATKNREKIPTIAQLPTPLREIKPSPATSGEHRAVRFVPEIRRIKISGGNFRFLDAAGKFVAAFEGLEFRSNFRDAMTLNGNANIAKISLRERFFLQQMRSSFRYDPSELELSQMLAQAGGGDLTGQFAMQPQAEDSPFRVAVRFRNVEAERLIAEAGGEKGVVKGKLDGSFEAIGKIADPNALKGKGEIFLRDGQLRQYSVLAALGQLLQIEELTQLHLEQAQGKYHVTAGIVTVEELILRSPNIRLSAKGTITLEGKLRLDSQLAINDKIRNQLFKPIRANFQPLSEPGYFAVDFEVGGTLDRPKSNLVEKVVGRDLKDFGSVINSFLGGGKTDPGKKEKSSDTPTQSPAPSPASPPPRTTATVGSSP